MCDSAIEIDLQLLDQEECPMCGCPVAASASAIRIVCPHCRAETACNVTDATPVCHACSGVLRTDLGTCDKCGRNADLARLDVVTDPGDAAKTLGRVCDLCMREWHRFMGASDVETSIVYMRPISVRMTPEWIALTKCREEGWHDWAGSRRTAEGSR